MTVADLLREKGHKVITVPAETSAWEAMGLLVKNNIGALVVVNKDGFPQGMISERDFVKLCYERPAGFKEVTVESVMNKKVVIGTPSDSLDEVMNMMTTNRFRHLPIIDNWKLVGIVSIGDVIKALLTETKVTNRYLEEYMFGNSEVRN